MKHYGVFPRNGSLWTKRETLSSSTYVSWFNPELMYHDIVVPFTNVWFMVLVSGHVFEVLHLQRGGGGWGDRVAMSHPFMYRCRQANGKECRCRYKYRRRNNTFLVSLYAPFQVQRMISKFSSLFSVSASSLTITGSHFVR